MQMKNTMLEPDQRKSTYNTAHCHHAHVHIPIVMFVSSRESETVPQRMMASLTLACVVLCCVVCSRVLWDRSKGCKVCGCKLHGNLRAYCGKHSKSRKKTNKRQKREGQGQGPQPPPPPPPAAGAIAAH